MKNIAVYILAKNEEANIDRCLSALSGFGWPAYVLDSGSTDKTSSIVKKFDFAEFVPYKYTNHCAAYNEILSQFSTKYDYVAILDADMVITPALKEEILSILAQENSNYEALIARVKMFSEGHPVPHGSLCPPKPFFFKTGSALFVSSGHAERLSQQTRQLLLEAPLIHDDRKPYEFYLQSQHRYSRNLIERGLRNEASARDRARLRFPIFVLGTPIFSYIFKLGFLDGRAGLIYALDRLIAEAIMYRQSLASKLKAASSDTYSN